MTIIKKILILFLLFGFINSNAQFNSPFASNQFLVKKPVADLHFSGYYRFLGFVRNQQEVFPNNSGKTTAIISGDYFREPMLLLKVKGKTKDDISFGADLMINSLYKGPETSNSLTLDLGLNLKTSIKTNFGNFNFSSGGVSWYRQSRLTVWGNRSFNRMSIYDRRPQTPLTDIPNKRYANYYNNGLVNEGIRYGSRAFQGLFLNAHNLPLNFSIKGVIGKSAFNRSYFENSDNYTACFQLKNQIDKQSKIAYNYLVSSADLDTLSHEKRNYSIHTLEINKKWENIIFQLETGFGKYISPDKDLGIGEAILFNLKTDKSSKIPVDFQLYRISPHFVNVTGNFLNTTILEVFPNIPGVGTTIRTPYKSPMVGLGFPINNRQGISLNTDFELGKLKINGGIGYFSEIDTSHGGISYRHNVNGQTLSRIYLFAQNWGPYNFLNSTYRGVFEEATISDTNHLGLTNFKKHFNTIEFQVKYSNKIREHNYYLFALTRFNSCQKRLYYLPQFNNKALISQISQEIDFSYELNKNTVLVLSYGIERVIGNEFTDIGDGGEPSSINLILELLGQAKPENYNNARNQRNRLIGLGLDYKIGENAMLFFRHNRYQYFDPNFIENHLKGTETMLELKITF